MFAKGEFGRRAQEILNKAQDYGSKLGITDPTTEQSRVLAMTPMEQAEQLPQAMIYLRQYNPELAEKIDKVLTEGGIQKVLDAQGVKRDSIQHKMMALTLINKMLEDSVPEGFFSLESVKTGYLNKGAPPTQEQKDELEEENSILIQAILSSAAKNSDNQEHLRNLEPLIDRALNPDPNRTEELY